MLLNKKQRFLLKKLMTNSAKKGNLANAGMVLEKGRVVASAESLVASNHDATAHSERMLVSEVGKSRKSNYTPGLTMVTVVEPCLMCMSACSQAGYKKIAYVIPAKKYIGKIPYMTDVMPVNKEKIAGMFVDPLKLEHLQRYEKEFTLVFEELMKRNAN
jgi:tRNA(Arg) A34 adenosine deaminase TadA